jgi:hypothetical protein
MTPFVLAFVMCAAVLHAGWNAVLRGGGDRVWSMTLMMVSITVVTATALPLLPWPNAASWPYIIATAIVHVGYNLSLRPGWQCAFVARWSRRAGISHRDAGQYGALPDR